MKLYNLDHSPYATRVRMQIHQKKLDIAIEPPPVALRTPEFAARFPLAKIPVLELDDGQHLADSWVIMEYIEDLEHGVSLRPADPLDCAHMRSLARYADTCLGPEVVFPLFKFVGAGNKADGVSEVMAAMEVELQRLERLLQASPDFRDRDLHLGDIALMPHMDYLLLLAPMFGSEDPLANYPLIGAWRERVIAEEGVARGSEEMLTAVKAFFGG